MAGAVTKSETAPRRKSDGGVLGMLRNEIDGLFQNYFGEPMELFQGGPTSPSIDLAETDREIEVKTDLPGIKADEVEIEIRNNVLTIHGEHSEEKELKKGKGRKFHRVERRHGSFSRSVWLPCSVQEDKVTADLSEGVLTITLPKSETEKSHKIKVKG